jgi:NAD dependent epimerase/dehydratase
VSEALRDRRVLVTGAGGFIGSHLVEAVVAAGARVRALVHYNALGSAGWLDEIAPEVRRRVDVWRGDIRDSGYVGDLVAEQEIVLHLAALIAIPHSYVAPRSFVDVNVSGTLNVLDACRRHGVARLVQTSTSEVYGTAITTPMTEAHPLQAQSPYAASKIGADALAEAYARSFATPVVILRPFNTYGPRQSERAVIPTIIRQVLDPDCRAVRIGDVTPVRDFNYVDDTVAAFVAAATAAGVASGEACNSGTGVAVSVGEVIARVEALTGIEKPVETDQARHRPAASEVRHLLADADRLRGATGWRPRVPLDEGLKRTIDWWRARFDRGAVRAGRDYAT